MCKELHEELQRGQAAAEELVDHILRMGAASGERTVLRADRDGKLMEWAVIARITTKDEG